MKVLLGHGLCLSSPPPQTFLGPRKSNICSKYATESALTTVTGDPLVASDIAVDMIS